MQPAKKILAVDDNDEALFALKSLLEMKGFEVVTATSGEEALRIGLEQADSLGLILLDVNLPKMDGYEVARQLKSDSDARFVPLILLTAKSDLESLLTGLNAGADSYLTKPYQSAELLARIHAMLRMRDILIELKQSLHENSALREIVSERTSFNNIIGKSSSMREVFTLIDKVKDADVPVLITGESGTGKELVAKAIHFNSTRKHKPFVVQNCAALSENLLESELFGHVKGSFTGAIKDKRGLFEAADGGSFFLDELGEMSSSLQVKLLRVLQDGTFTPVGGTSMKKVDVRILAATNRNLRQMIAKSTFREDLYYRLNVISVELPPLRERRDDIPLLVEHFLKSYQKKKPSTSLKHLSSHALNVLTSYNFPGNIRELENEVERAIIMSGSEETIEPEHLSQHVRSSSSKGASPHASGTLDEALTTLEKEMIVGALERTGGNKSRAAAELGISRTNLIKKVQAHQIEDTK